MNLILKGLKKPLSLLWLPLILLSINVNAKVEYKNQLGISLGFVTQSYSQQAAAFDSDRELSSGSSSVVSGDLTYEFFGERQKSFFLRFTGSGIAGEVSKYYFLGVGQRYYFGADGTSANFKDKKVRIETNPLFRYYYGWDLGITSFIYETETDVRTDLGVEFGGHLGALYAADKTTSYKAELALKRGTGVETSSLNVAILFGVSYFTKNFF